MGNRAFHRSVDSRPRPTAFCTTDTAEEWTDIGGAAVYTREVIEDGEEKRFVVKGLVNEVKDEFLKERSVLVIFQGEARNLARSVKEDLIRAYEDGWTARRLFDPGLRRGRVKFDSPNVASYMAKAKEIAQWLLREGELKIKLEQKEYMVQFKPRLTKQEMQNVRIQEAAMKFWIMALRVPLNAYYYPLSAVKWIFGEVIAMHNPEYDRDRPKLMNVKFDMPPEARYRIDDDLVIESPEGERWKVEIVSPYTDWCRRCTWYYHTEESCPRHQADEGRRVNGVRQGGARRAQSTISGVHPKSRESIWRGSWRRGGNRPVSEAGPAGLAEGHADAEHSVTSTG
ncbi:hypothetical protein CBR_g699 [Chara braunii]|uniref:Uncharacterized protein n=1 Tax=Chara braunii TaxID=69332 RepID=A0A388KBZ4_CHABU|nr:hypothetical protein CBR_g699 [Chara braunii]|eukprot:GBG67570.1 hypothetical protein CBR_g699 [Chara braunii]